VPIFIGRGETPEEAPTDWLGVLCQPTPRGSSRWGIIMPMEGRRWSVSLCVNHGEAPPDDIDGFMAFAKSFRMPTIYNAIRGAKRIGDIVGPHGPPFYECPKGQLQRTSSRPPADSGL
jgi:hypothetical protein